MLFPLARLLFSIYLHVLSFTSFGSVLKIMSLLWWGLLCWPFIKNHHLPNPPPTSSSVLSALFFSIALLLSNFYLFCLLSVSLHWK